MAVPRNKAVLATLNQEGDTSMSDKSAYREKLEARLEQWRAEIDKLQAKAAEASADARREYDDQVAELRKQQEEARDKLKELDEASDDAWEDMKGGFEKAWDKLGDAVKSARERFS
jgi:F0F1-type ATP synthase membrane subunit b/b'